MLKDLKGGQCPPEQRAVWREGKPAHWAWAGLGGTDHTGRALWAMAQSSYFFLRAVARPFGALRGKGNTLVSRDDPSGNNVEGLCYSGKCS